MINQPRPAILSLSAGDVFDLATPNFSLRWWSDQIIIIFSVDLLKFNVMFAGSVQLSPAQSGVQLEEMKKLNLQFEEAGRRREWSLAGRTVWRCGVSGVN